ncbi:hypothetical protein RFI_08404, partial [Reticulomyxa filosa]
MSLVDDNFNSGTWLSAVEMSRFLYARNLLESIYATITLTYDANTKTKISVDIDNGFSQCTEKIEYRDSTKETNTSSGRRSRKGRQKPEILPEVSKKEDDDNPNEARYRLLMGQPRTFGETFPVVIGLKGFAYLHKHNKKKEEEKKSSEADNGEETTVEGKSSTPCEASGEHDNANEDEEKKEEKEAEKGEEEAPNGSPGHYASQLQKCIRRGDGCQLSLLEAIDGMLRARVQHRAELQFAPCSGVRQLCWRLFISAIEDVHPYCASKNHTYWSMNVLMALALCAQVDPSFTLPREIRVIAKQTALCIQSSKNAFDWRKFKPKEKATKKSQITLPDKDILKLELNYKLFADVVDRQCALDRDLMRVMLNVMPCMRSDLKLLLIILNKCKWYVKSERAHYTLPQITHLNNIPIDNLRWQPPPLLEDEAHNRYDKTAEGNEDVVGSRFLKCVYEHFSQAPGNFENMEIDPLSLPLSLPLPLPQPNLCKTIKFEFTPQDMEARQAAIDMHCYQHIILYVQANLLFPPIEDEATYNVASRMWDWVSSYNVREEHMKWRPPLPNVIHENPRGYGLFQTIKNVQKTMMNEKNPLFAMCEFPDLPPLDHCLDINDRYSPMVPSQTTYRQAFISIFGRRHLLSRGKSNERAITVTVAGTVAAPCMIQYGRNPRISNAAAEGDGSNPYHHKRSTVKVSARYIKESHRPSAKYSPKSLKSRKERESNSSKSLQQIFDDVVVTSDEEGDKQEDEQMMEELYNPNEINADGTGREIISDNSDSDDDKKKEKNGEREGEEEEEEEIKNKESKKLDAKKSRIVFKVEDIEIEPFDGKALLQLPKSIPLSILSGWLRALICKCFYISLYEKSETELMECYDLHPLDVTSVRHLIQHFGTILPVLEITSWLRRQQIKDSKKDVHDVPVFKDWCELTMRHSIVPNNFWRDVLTKIATQESGNVDVAAVNREGKRQLVAIRYVTEGSCLRLLYGLSILYPTVLRNTGRLRFKVNFQSTQYSHMMEQLKVLAFTEHQRKNWIVNNPNPSHIDVRDMNVDEIGMLFVKEELSMNQGFSPPLSFLLMFYL